MSKLDTLTAKINAEIADLQAALAEATQREVLVVGNVYSIHVGKGETARVIEATLVGQRTRENGAAEFRFTAGEGFDARFYDVSYNKVVVEEVEGQLNSAQIAKQIARLETKRDGLAEKLTNQAELETLVDGQTYNIRIGKGETADVVPAVLMAQRFNEEKGAQEFAFFYGSGFEAKVLHCGIRKVVLEEAEALAEEVGDEDGAEETVAE